MDWDNQLIALHLTTCDFFFQLSTPSYLKISPNSNSLFTYEETITIFNFGILNDHKNVKSINYQTC